MCNFQTVDICFQQATELYHKKMMLTTSVHAKLFALILEWSVILFLFFKYFLLLFSWSVCACQRHICQETAFCPVPIKCSYFDLWNVLGYVFLTVSSYTFFFFF